MNRNEMQQELINLFIQGQNKNREDYIKKLKGKVDIALKDEYDLVILKKKPVVKREKKSWEDK